jgi:hypothetical protein
MRTRSRFILVGFSLVVSIVVGVYVHDRLSGPMQLDAPPPQVVADAVDTLPAAEESVIDAQVTYNLASAVDSLEAAVPRTYGDIEERLPIASNTRASFGFTASRSPFRARVVGRTLTLSADIEYQGRIWYRPPIGPELSAGCGVGAAPRPRVRVTLVSTGRLTPRWQLRTRTSVLRLEPYSDEPRDRCRVTVLRIDATDRVIDATRNWLERDLVKFDEAVARWPVRDRFEKLWTLIQRPIRLTEGVSLEIHPYAARLDSIRAVGDSVSARLRMLALPRVVTVPGPANNLPLPPLQADRRSGGGAHVVIEAMCSYQTATMLLQRGLVGRRIGGLGHRVRITDVRLSSVGGGRVALEVMLSGHVHGQLYFIGTPSLDSLRHQVAVPDLDYDVGTAQLMVQGLAWLNGVDLREYLRGRACLPDSAVIGRLQGLAETGINRTLAPGVTLGGRIHDARGTSVMATAAGIRVRAVADAEFTLAIDRGPSLPKLPALASIAHE